MDNPVTKMKGAGGAEVKKLIEAGILTMAHLKEQDDAQLVTLLVDTVSGVSLAKLTE